MAVNTYDIGAVVRLTATYTDTGDLAADPTKVTFRVKAPGGTLSTDTSTGSSVANPAIGTYHLDVNIDAAGVWSYWVSSTGTVQAAGEDWFRVNERLTST